MKAQSPIPLLLLFEVKRSKSAKFYLQWPAYLLRPTHASPHDEARDDGHVDGPPPCCRQPWRPCCRDDEHEPWRVGLTATGYPIFTTSPIDASKLSILSRV